MSKKSNQIYTVVAVIVIIAALIWLFKAKRSAPDDQMQNQTASQNSNQPTASSTKPASSQNIWTGTLEKSDSPAKGNLILVTSDRTIYMQTSRDFNALLGKAVSVSYTGDLNSFTLTSIIAK